VVHLAQCSYYHSIFVCKNDKEVYSTGRNDYGQLGLGVNDDQKDTPKAIHEFKGKDVSSVGCGQYHTIVALNVGDVYSFGRNECG
jgi:RCC1 and BTB domain-containing protein